MDYLICNRSDLGGLSGVQKRICGTGECSSDIKCDSKFSVRSSIRGVGYDHDGSEGKATDRVRNRSIAKRLQVSVGPATLSLLQYRRK